jgi:hypothetical protein
MPLAATNILKQAALLAVEQERDTSKRNNIDVIKEVDNRLEI